MVNGLSVVSRGDGGLQTVGLDGSSGPAEGSASVTAAAVANGYCAVPMTHQLMSIAVGGGSSCESIASGSVVSFNTTGVNDADLVAAATCPGDEQVS